jgi:hypothetical protein
MFEARRKESGEILKDPEMPVWGRKPSASSVELKGLAKPDAIFRSRAKDADLGTQDFFGGGVTRS